MPEANADTAAAHRIKTTAVILSVRIFLLLFDYRFEKTKP
jgi:hypothetical protein